mgnify:CR=1 FL=1
MALILELEPLANAPTAESRMLEAIAQAAVSTEDPHDFFEWILHYLKDINVHASHK